ncbi:hypothetical protein C8R46DRAFT_1316360 [Mycena filopes]|nr:hypothetical protein C8R46DRAFT_1316360 [Mycena filopes]
MSMANLRSSGAQYTYQNRRASKSEAKFHRIPDEDTATSKKQRALNRIYAFHNQSQISFVRPPYGNHGRASPSIASSEGDAYGDIPNYDYDSAAGRGSNHPTPASHPPVAQVHKEPREPELPSGPEISDALHPTSAIGGGVHPYHHPPPASLLPIAHLRDSVQYKPLVMKPRQLTEDEEVIHNHITWQRYISFQREVCLPPQDLSDHIVKVSQGALIKQINPALCDMTSYPKSNLDVGHVMTCFGDMEGKWLTTQWRKKKGEYVYWVWVNHGTKQTATVRVKLRHVFQPKLAVKVKKAVKSVGSWLIPRSLVSHKW